MAGTAGFLQDARDNLTALQILQIGANIIDQAKADDFPTQIQFAGNNSYTVRGVEDLPYLYGVRNWVMRTGASGTTGVILFQPELWNPHSYPGSSANVAASAMPANFRARVGLDATSTTTPISGVIAVYTNGTTSPDESPNCPFNTGVTQTPLTFNAGEANGFWGFREPTLLSQINTPTSCSLSGSSYTDYPAYTPNPYRRLTGFLVASFPWFSSGTSVANICEKVWASDNGTSSSLRFYLDYQDQSGNWITYDEQPYQPFGSSSITLVTYPDTNAAQDLALQEVNSSYADYYGGVRTDPRTSRWGYMTSEYLWAIPMVGGTNSNNEYCTYRPDSGISFGSHVGGRLDNGIVGTFNNYTKVDRGFQHGYWTENSIRPTYQTDSGDNGLRYIRDPDGVARRAMGGYWSDTANGGTPAATSGTSPMPPVVGLPMATANYSSRPTLLHRPFRSIAELGYVFSDTPWRNLDFSFPESGDSPLLDVFCINENSNTTGLVAGRVNLNGSQAPVLQALLAGTLLDKDDTTNPVLSSTQASVIATQLVTRTSSGTTALTSRADLVGTWNLAGTPASAAAALKSASPPDPNSFYTGFSADIGTLDGMSGTPVALVPRQRESAMRALSDAGTARMWNLMIDVVSQTGSYPSTAQELGDFDVQSESHYWLHVAIDRSTGQIVDQNLEQVPTGPVNINFTSDSAATITVAGNQPSGSAISTIIAADSTPGSTLTYSLVSGTGDDDNASFTLSGSTLQTAAALNNSTQSTYSIRVQATDQLGLSFDQILTVVLASDTGVPAMPLWAELILPLLLLFTGCYFFLSKGRRTGPLQSP